MRIRCILLVALFALLLPVCAPAQVLYGSLVGNVLDPNKASVPNASVRLLNMLTGVALDAHTDAQGEYHFNNVQSGTYEVQCSASGFRTFRRTQIEVPANEVVRVNVLLELG